MERTKALIVLCLLVLLSGCATNSSEIDSPSATSQNDVEFAKTTFQALVRGDSAVEKSIDWESLRMNGLNVGAQYLALPNDAERADFRKALIARYSASWQVVGARADALTNWRIQDEGSARTIVACESPAQQVLLITVTKREGKQKMSALGVGRR